MLMAARSVAMESRSGQKDRFWGQFVKTQQSAGLTALAGSLVSRNNELLASQEAGRCSTCAGNEAPCVDAGRCSSKSCRQDHLWGRFFLDQTLRWDNRQKQKTQCGSQDFLCSDNFCKPTWVHSQLRSVDVHSGRRGAALNWRERCCDSHRPAGAERGVTVETVSSLCQEGQLSEAVEAMGVLVNADCHISDSLFCTVLKECVVERNLPLCRRVHALAVKQGYESDTFVCNHILRMYGSYARLKEAMDLFTTVAKPDAFTWSAIISAHVKHGEDKRAIQLYRLMRRSNETPDGHVFVAALQACAKGADLESGQQVHADVLASGMEPSLFVSSCLVDMYAKCGRFEDARRVFDALDQKDVVMWNAMIAGYSQQGMGQEALRLYSAMEEEGTAVPTSVTFVSLLQACASVGPLALEKGRRIHEQIRERGLQGDVFAGSSLVNMYAKCGSLEDAQTVFDGLVQKDVVTWSTMIGAYSQKGMGEEALRVDSAMQEEGVAVPDAVTFVCLLQACANVGPLALERGRELHAQIKERGHQGDGFVANSLVNMYAKCGSLKDAQTLFHGLGVKDVVTWNAMIAGYSQQGMGEEALNLYDAMQGHNVEPDSVTFVSLLQACGSVGNLALETGRKLHAQVRKRGLQADVFVANGLVTMYAKCGSIDDARVVFDGSAQKDVATWNAMIAGYSQLRLSLEALGLLRAMQEEGMVAPNSATFVPLLQAFACAGASALEKGKQLHAQIRECLLHAEVSIANSLVNMYAKCGTLEDARGVFDGLPQKDTVTWNAMIAGYSQKGMGVEALHLLSAMQNEGLMEPNALTFTSLLQACSRVGVAGLEQGKQLHAQIRERGLHTELLVANSLVSMYAKAGSVEDARQVFDAIGGKNVVTWNAMMAGYAQQGLGQEAIDLFIAMQQDGAVSPDSVTFVCFLQACARLGALGVEKGKQVHAQIREQGLEGDMFVASSLVNMYAKCGSLEDARSVFDGLHEKNVVTWSAMIAGYSQQGMGQESLGLYRAMQHEGIVAPNDVIFVCLLQSCANVAALHLGKQVHAHIKQEGLESDLLVASSLIHMYGKCGSMADASEVFDALTKRDTATWNALIAGYMRQGDSDLVFDRLVKMQEDGTHPDSITFLSVLTVCSHRGLVDKGQEYFEAMGTVHGISPTVDHYTCMVDLLGRAGLLEEALALARTMPVLPEAAVWRTVLGACQKWSNVEVACHAFHEAVKLDQKDAAVYVLMSNIYTSVEMWEQAQEIQERRKRVGAWKQPGQSWWTDMDGQLHLFSVGDHYPGSEASKAAQL